MSQNHHREVFVLARFSGMGWPSPEPGYNVVGVSPLFSSFGGQFARDGQPRIVGICLMQMTQILRSRRSCIWLRLIRDWPPEVACNSGDCTHDARASPTMILQRVLPARSLSPSHFSPWSILDNTSPVVARVVAKLQPVILKTSIKSRTYRFWSRSSAHILWSFVKDVVTCANQEVVHMTVKVYVCIIITP